MLSTKHQHKCTCYPRADACTVWDPGLLKSSSALFLYGTFANLSMGINAHLEMTLKGKVIVRSLVHSGLANALLSTAVWNIFYCTVLLWVLILPCSFSVTVQQPPPPPPPQGITKGIVAKLHNSYWFKFQSAEWIVKLHAETQTHKRFERVLFIRTKQNMHFFKLIPFIKLENERKWYLNNS